MEKHAVADVLVSTEWVDEHRNDNIKIAEVDVEPTSYEEGHIPGAIGWNWKNQLSDNVIRDILSKDQLEKFLGDSGIDNNTTIILYGDNNNWFAAWAFWQLKIYGHRDVRIMDGGRKKWLAEGRELTKEVPKINPKKYTASNPDLSIRSYLKEVMKASEDKSEYMVDVRSPVEFTGELLAPPGLPETCQRGGHIDGAVNVTWSKACNEDGTFKTFDELRKLYEEAGIKKDKPVITYCRIGERSSHTWFVLKHLLGYENVKNYDGSWTEWGNLVGVPIKRGS